MEILITFKMSLQSLKRNLERIGSKISVIMWLMNVYLLFQPVAQFLTNL